MNILYFGFLSAGLILCTLLFAWRLRRARLKCACAWLALPMTAVLAPVFSKLLYFLCKLPEQLDNYGLAALVRMRPAEFSFVGGCAGVVLAMLIASRLCKHSAMPVLDAYAPCGALLAAFVRMAEGLLDENALVGVGDFVENEALYFFPVAVENQMLYSWFYAVFMLEAVLALIVAAAGFIRSHNRSFPAGRVFLHTMFYLALPQIFSERMLSQCMKWGFIRIEQLLCAVIVFGVILYACIKTGKRGAYLPAVLDLVCVAVLIDIEFTLDNKPPFGLEMAPATCYAIMIAVLCCMAALSFLAYRKLNRIEK